MMSQAIVYKNIIGFRKFTYVCVTPADRRGVTEVLFLNKFSLIAN